MKIDGWRRKIDQIDAALLHLLNLRAELAVEAGRVKDEEGISLRVPAREQEILQRMKESNPGPFDAEAIDRIYRLILAESVRAQELDGSVKGTGSKATPDVARGSGAASQGASQQAGQRKSGRRWR